MCCLHLHGLAVEFLDLSLYQHFCENLTSHNIVTCLLFQMLMHFLDQVEPPCRNSSFITFFCLVSLACLLSNGHLFDVFIVDASKPVIKTHLYQLWYFALEILPNVWFITPSLLITQKPYVYSLLSVYIPHFSYSFTSYCCLCPLISTIHTNKHCQSLRADARIVPGS